MIIFIESLRLESHRQWWFACVIVIIPRIHTLPLTSKSYDSL